MNITKAIQSAFEYHRKGNFEQAEYLYKKILKKQPDNPDILHMLGTLFCQLANYDLAIKYIRRALQLSPADSASAHYNLGLALQNKGQLDESIIHYQKTIELNPSFDKAYCNLGFVFKEKGQLDEAISHCQKALQLNPSFAEAYCNLGYALLEKGQPDEAISHCQKALQLNPSFAQAYYNLGCALKEKGQLDEACSHYQKAIELNPSFANANSDMSLILLLLGNFKEGWEKYEWRWRTKAFMQSVRTFSKPLWNGSDIKTRTILLQTEQGLGDTIQFIRYAPLIAQKSAKIIVECQKELVSVIKSVAGIQQVIDQGEELPEFDFYCPLLSLPLICNTTLESIPAKAPYITADSLLVQKWGNKIQHNSSKLKIGLVWAGNPEHRNDRNRSCALETFLPLAARGDVSLYSLQKGEAAQQAKYPSIGMNLIDYTGEIADFSDTVALIENLDLVITVDTAVAHLAGALGKPVWTLLPFVPDWRWMLHREDSPWYPTMRLFRQPSPGDWNSVMIRVSKELEIYWECQMIRKNRR